MSNTTYKKNVSVDKYGITVTEEIPGMVICGTLRKVKTVKNNDKTFAVFQFSRNWKEYGDQDYTSSWGEIIAFGGTADFILKNMGVGSKIAFVSNKIETKISLQEGTQTFKASNDGIPYATTTFTVLNLNINGCDFADVSFSQLPNYGIDNGNGNNNNNRQNNNPPQNGNGAEATQQTYRGGNNNMDFDFNFD